MNGHRCARLLVALLGFTATTGCGARTPLELSDEDSSSEVEPDAGGGERSCPPNCTVGHACCFGSCGGPAAEMPSDCCSCLPGEVDSRECGGGCGE